MASGSYTTKSVEKLIEEKLVVLRDFGICWDDNEEHWRKEMTKAVEARPYSDPEITLEHFTRPLIMKRLGDV